MATAELTLYDTARRMAEHIAPAYKPAFIDFSMLILETQIFKISVAMPPERAAQFEAAAKAGDGIAALGRVLSHFAENADSLLWRFPELEEQPAEYRQRLQSEAANKAKAAIYEKLAIVADLILDGTETPATAIDCIYRARVAATHEIVEVLEMHISNLTQDDPEFIVAEIMNATTPGTRVNKILELNKCLDTLDPKSRAYYESYCTAAAIEEGHEHPEFAAALVSCVKPKSAALTTISHDPVIRAMTHGETGEVLRSANPATGELAIYSLKSGELTLEEKAALIAIKDLRDAGNITPKGFIYCTLGQMYRARRGQKATGGIPKGQKEAELNILDHMAEKWHKYELNEPMRIWGGFDAKRGRVKLIGFDVHEGTINGMEDDLIVFHNTPFLVELLDRLQFCETLDQEVKEIKEYRYTLTLKEPITINGKRAKSRSFKSNEQRRAFCAKHGITKENIADHGEALRVWPQTGGRIALREALTEFVFDYINARGAGRNVSNRKPYKDIFEHCGISTANRSTVKCAKEDIAVILDYWTKSELVPWLKGWAEYTNKRSTKPDGIEIYLERSGTGAE